MYNEHDDADDDDLGEGSVFSLFNICTIMLNLYVNTYVRF